MKIARPQALIRKLFLEDLKDRQSFVFKKYSVRKRWVLISKRDQQRIKIIQRILASKLFLRGVDYFRAGLIFQHGQSIDLIKQAKLLGKKSFQKGYKKGGWLYAAATDRILMMRGKKQKFGTQFRKVNNKWELHPVRVSTSDLDRKRYNVLSLQKIKKVIKSLNRKESKVKASVGFTVRR